MSQKKKNKKKPRAESIYATTSAAVTEIAFSFDPSTDTVSFETPVTDTYNETFYGRTKGRKILNRTKTDSSNLKFSTDSSLRKYDKLVAIDTNTVKVSDQDLSVTGIIVAQWQQGKSSRGCVQAGTPFCIEYQNLIDPKEKIGWIVAIRQLIIEGCISSSENVAVIVDSFLDEIPQINSRKIPVVDKYYLPEKLTLIYASSDAGNEYMANKLIRQADKAANILIGKVKDGSANSIQKTNSDSTAVGFRVVRSVHGFCSWS